MMRLAPRIRRARAAPPGTVEEDAAAAERRNDARAFLFCLWSVGDEELARRLCISAVARADFKDPLGRVHVARAQMIRAVRRKRADFAPPPDAEQVALKISKTLNCRNWSGAGSPVSTAVLAAIARQPVAFRDALILALLFGFSTAETADALALPYPRAHALISEGKVRLNVDYLKSPVSSDHSGSALSSRASFESGVAESFRLTQSYIDAHAVPRSPQKGWNAWLKSLRPLLSVCATTAWFAVPVSGAIGLSQCLLIRAFDDSPSLEKTSAPIEPAHGVRRVHFEEVLTI